MYWNTSEERKELVKGGKKERKKKERKYNGKKEEARNITSLNKCRRKSDSSSATKISHPKNIVVKVMKYTQRNPLQHSFPVWLKCSKYLNLRNYLKP
jgi:hypothetical protein